MRGRHVRAYRALLRVYPRRFRAEYEEEMCRVFAQQLHYARVVEGWPGVVRVWARSLVDLVTTAPSEHLEEEMLVASPVGASSWRPRQDASPPRRWVLIGLGPVWALLALLFVQSWGGAVFLNPPSRLRWPAPSRSGLSWAVERSSHCPAVVGSACTWRSSSQRSLKNAIRQAIPSGSRSMAGPQKYARRSTRTPRGSGWNVHSWMPVVPS